MCNETCTRINLLEYLGNLYKIKLARITECSPLQTKCQTFGSVCHSTRLGPWRHCGNEVVLVNVLLCSVIEKDLTRHNIIILKSDQGICFLCAECSVQCICWIYFRVSLKMHNLSENVFNGDSRSHWRHEMNMLQ